MPAGMEVATFNMNSASITIAGMARGGASFQPNHEGSVPGARDGTAIATMTATSDNLQSGAYQIIVASYLKGGSVVKGNGSGTLRSLGGHRWQARGTDITSDGHTVATEGVIELATRSYSGAVLE